MKHSACFNKDCKCQCETCLKFKPRNDSLSQKELNKLNYETPRIQEVKDE